MKMDGVRLQTLNLEASSFAPPLEERYFEDYLPGSVYECGAIEVQESEMIDFALRFDPQPFHTDPVAAKQSVYGGLIASGWYTVSLTMRAMVDHYVSRVSSQGSPGVDEIRWLKPVRPGDTLSVRVTLLEARRSRSKPHRGIIRGLTEVINQTGEIVMTMKSASFVQCRNTNGSDPLAIDTDAH
jgi:acyl dehydratase